MDSLLNTSFPSPENQQTPNPHPKLFELASDSGGRRIPRTGTRLQMDQEQLSCPRCDSTNTKFCYYNNYNLSQPRHFCKSCRRYWTRGGTLRNVPVGGGTRKAASSSFNKRPRTAATSNSVNLVSSGSDNGASGRTQTLDSDPYLGSRSIGAKPESLSCFWSDGQMGLGGGLFPFNGFGPGLGPGLVYEQAVLDWPMEQVGCGDGDAVVVSGESPGCGTWQMGGGADDGGLVEADYFSWPDLAMSTPSEALK